MKRYSIIARMRGAKIETPVCEVDSNPEMMLAAVQAKRLLIDDGKGTRKIAVPKYDHAYILENVKTAG